MRLFLHEFASHLFLDYTTFVIFGDFHKDMVASVPSGEVYSVGR